MDRLNRISSVTQIPTGAGRSTLRKVSHSDSAFATLLTEKTLEEERRRRKKQLLKEGEVDDVTSQKDNLSEISVSSSPENWGQKADLPITESAVLPQDIQSVKHRFNSHHSNVYQKLNHSENDQLVLELKEEVRTPVRLPSERTMPLAAVIPLVDKKI